MVRQHISPAERDSAQVITETSINPPAPSDEAFQADKDDLDPLVTACGGRGQYHGFRQAPSFIRGDRYETRQSRLPNPPPAAWPRPGHDGPDRLPVGSSAVFASCLATRVPKDLGTVIAIGEVAPKPACAHRARRTRWPPGVVAWRAPGHSPPIASVGDRVDVHGRRLPACTHSAWAPVCRPGLANSHGS